MRDEFCSDTQNNRISVLDRRKIMNIPLRKNLPLNVGRIISAENVRILQTTKDNTAVHQPPQIAATEDSASQHETEVIMLRDGDRVKTIVIKCKCGEVISLDCEY